MKEYLTPRNIAVALGALMSLPALLWSLIIVMAGGMKTVPSLSKDELAIGVVPSLVLLLIYTIVAAFHDRLKLSMPLLVTCLLAGGVCTLAIGLGFFAYLLQPGG